MFELFTNKYPFVYHEFVYFKPDAEARKKGLWQNHLNESNMCENSLLKCIKQEVYLYDNLFTFFLQCILK